MALLPGGSAAATGPVTAADGRPGPWYRRIDWSSTFWTVFLLIPLTFVIRADMPLSYKVVGVIGLLGFTWAYTWAVSTMPLWLDLPEGRASSTSCGRRPADSHCWRASQPPPPRA